MKTVRHSTAVFFRFLAILAVIFAGITAIIPQSTKKDDETLFPVWSDVDMENSADIIALYEKGIIIGGIDGKYGVDEPFSACEAAYAVVNLYEDKKGIDISFPHYNPNQSENYIKRAIKYKLWDESMPCGSEPVSREQMAFSISSLAKDGELLNNAEFLPDEEMYKYADEVIMMYNLGITLDKSIALAYEPDKILTRGEAVKLISMYLEPSERLKIKIPDYAVLETTLNEKMSAWQGDWSLYFEDINTGKTISINSHQVYSASLIKLFVAQTVYQKIADGVMAETETIDNELYKMIIYSDNDAWKYLAKSIGGSYSRGMQEVTKVANVAGFIDTGQFYQGSHKNYNFTSVNDCGMYLRRIINGDIVNEEMSGKILSLLKQQQHVQKIPSGVPDGVTVANKTGELDYMQGDAAIVYAPSGTYILVIIGDSLENAYGQIVKFTDLSKTVYDFLN
ncbi:MAG: class A beta-lactamase-related serine hydrolase [Clostridiales bacterium]|nr:class A beta-lactamase-related serine hydrolase [Clostridiales bacterium]